MSKKLSILHRMILICLTAVLIPFLLISSAFILMFRSAACRQTQDWLSTVSAQMCTKLDATFERLETVTYAITCNQSAMESLFNTELTKYQQFDYIMNTLEPTISQCEFYNAEIESMFFLIGNTLYPNGTRIGRLLTCEDMEWIQDYTANYEMQWMYGKPPFSKSILQSTDDAPTLYGVTQIFYPNNYARQKNFLVLRLNAEKLYDGLKLENVSVRLTNAAGDVLFQNGSKKIYSMETVVHGFTLEISTELMMNGIELLMTVVFLIVIVSMVFSYLIFYIFGKDMVKRLNVIYTGVSRVKEGNLHEPITVDKRRDELTEIAVGFNQMQSALKAHIEQRTQMERAYRESEIKALQAQINPHFLHNLFALIHAMALLAKQEEIANTAMEISAYYRSLFRRDTLYISIRNELENMRRYVLLQKMLKNDSFDVSFECPDELLDYTTVNMLLQPLVENAIEHGVTQARQRGKIWIRVAKNEDRIEISVIDNGLGFAEGFQAAVESSKSYGLINVLQRCHYLFGESYGISLQERKDALIEVMLSIPAQQYTPEFSKMPDK